jgi:hypothetical protein
MKKTVKVLALALLFGGLTTMTSCKKKYRKYDNNEVIENTYTGNIIPTSGGQDPGGDFTGDGDSGTYSFVWENPQNKATVAFDVTTESGGSAQIILNDAHGNEVLNETRPKGSNDTFAGVSKEGKKGKWLVTIKLSNFDGDGSYDVSPGN